MAEVKISAHCHFHAGGFGGVLVGRVGVERERYTRYMTCDPDAENWDGDYTGKVVPEMLQIQTTLSDFFSPRIANSKRSSMRLFWEEYQGLVEKDLGPGDELWWWADGEGMGSSRGLAIVRNAEILQAWLISFS